MPTLCLNPSADAVALLQEKFADKLMWGHVAQNPHPAAVTLLRANPGKISPNHLMGNTGEEAFVLWMELVGKNDPLVAHHIDKFANYNTTNAAVKLAREHDAIHWNILSASSNDAAVALLKANPDAVKWYDLSRNPHPWAIERLRAHPGKIDAAQLSRNPHPWALEYLRAHPDKINWGNLCSNTNPDAVAFVVDEHPDKIVWNILSTNPAIFKELVAPLSHRLVDWVAAELAAGKHPIDWVTLSRNQSDGAMELLLQRYPDKIDWYWLCYNPHPSAVEHVLANPDKIEWRTLSGNPHPDAVKHVLANRDKIYWTRAARNTHPDMVAEIKTWVLNGTVDWRMLSANASDEAVKILQTFPGKIVWDWLCINHNPAAVAMLSAAENADKLVVCDLALNPNPWAFAAATADLSRADIWEHLSRNANPDVMPILAANVDRVSWSDVWANPNIFVRVDAGDGVAVLVEKTVAKLAAVIGSCTVSSVAIGSAAGSVAIGNLAGQY